MRQRHVLTAFVILALCAPMAIRTARSQEAATGTTTIEQPGPRPRGFVVEQNGQPIGGGAPGEGVAISGAPVVVIQDQPRVTRLVVRNDVLFDFDKSDLRPEAADALGRVAEIIRQRKPRAVRIIGYTDSIGAQSYNQALSERRAEAVRQWLLANGGTLPEMQAEGRGEADPVAPNTLPNGADNPEGRQQNRRVEVLLER